MRSLKERSLVEKKFEIDNKIVVKSEKRDAEQNLYSATC